MVNKIVHEAERAIRDLIAKERPDDAILGEEFGETPGKNEYRWVLDPLDADDIAALDDVDLSAKIERASHSILGKIEVETGRGLFPLSIATARKFADKRIALVGEAAHLIPPIGAQGLNLGLRDTATIGELAIAAQRDGRDVGGAEVRAIGIGIADPLHEAHLAVVVETLQAREIRMQSDIIIELQNLFDLHAEIRTGTMVSIIRIWHSHVQTVIAAR